MRVSACTWLDASMFITHECAVCRARYIVYFASSMLLIFIILCARSCGSVCACVGCVLVCALVYVCAYMCVRLHVCFLLLLISFFTRFQLGDISSSRCQRSPTYVFHFPVKKTVTFLLLYLSFQKKRN